jgi:hypothetical protein
MVRDLYTRLGFALTRDEADRREWTLDLKNLLPHPSHVNTLPENDERE